MKKIFASVLLIVATFSISCSQTPSVEADANSVLGPVIEFEELVHDYGTIEKGGDGTYSFVFNNSGSDALVLSNVTSSCGCTVPQWPREPIKAGSESSIQVKYNTNRVGTFSKSISVYSNASDAPIVLRIKGKVIEAPAPEAAAAE